MLVCMIYDSNHINNTIEAKNIKSENLDVATEHFPEGAVSLIAYRMVGNNLSQGKARIPMNLEIYFYF